MPLKISRAVYEALNEHRAVVVMDDDGREHFMKVELKPLPAPQRNVSLAALEQIGGPDYDFEIELPRRDVWEPQLDLDD